jgi:hypothetical protein
MNTKAAAQELGLSIRTIQARCQNGTLNAAKIGGRWVITLDAPATPADKIRTACLARAHRAGAQVGLLEIFSGLEMTRAQFHAGVLELLDTGRALLEPEPKLRNLTEADREIAMRVGGETKHLLAIIG